MISRENTNSERMLDQVSNGNGNIHRGNLSNTLSSEANYTVVIRAYMKEYATPVSLAKECTGRMLRSTLTEFWCNPES